jgi:hypothetical protein
MLNKEQIQYLNDWHNYFLDIEEQGGGSPPSYNQEDIDYWNKWYKTINKEAKKNNETKVVMKKTDGVVPFVTSGKQPTTVKKEKKQVATNIQETVY